MLHPRDRRWLVTMGVVVLAATATLFTQVRLPAPRSVQRASQVFPYDGRFMFARLRYNVAPGGYYYQGLPAWAHGYPDAETNLMKILSEITYLSPHVRENNAFSLDDPRLARFPVSYMTEAGFWHLTDREALAFRAYLQKGGFVIFDDFRGGKEWETFQANMRRVLPEGRLVDLTPAHPIFHAFFEIGSFDAIPQYYDEERPVFRGIFEDNDPSRRLMAIVNFNTDVSNFWEFSGQGLKPIDESNQVYKLGVNYIVYGMTH